MVLSILRWGAGLHNHVAPTALCPSVTVYKLASVKCSVWGGEINGFKNIGTLESMFSTHTQGPVPIHNPVLSLARFPQGLAGNRQKKSLEALQVFQEY